MADDLNEDTGYATPDSAANLNESFVLTDNEEEDQANRRRSYSVNEIPRKSAAALKRYIVNGWNTISTANSRDFNDWDEDSDSTDSEDSSIDSFPDIETSSNFPLDQLPAFPHHFVDTTTPLVPPEPITQQTATRLIVEQRMLTNAVLQLFLTRDVIGVEGSVDERHNILKQGPLKKMSGGNYWKVKYVEIRKGNLCYYEDSGRGRKILHLRHDTLVKSSEKEHVFEICVQGSPSRLWMAQSEEEKTAWMRAIETAKIGGEETREIDMALHQDAIEVFEQMKQDLSAVTSVEDYENSVREFLEDWATIQIPIQWVKGQIELPLSTNNGTRHLPKELKQDISNFWTQMGSLNFSINEHALPRTSPFASERIFGGLTRCILEFDEAFGENLEDVEINRITEVQATCYTRDILIDVIRSRERREMDMVVNHLLEKKDCVVIEKTHYDENVVLEVSFAGDDMPQESSHIVTEKSGWLKTRRKNTKTWRRRFAMLSGAILAHYEAATPRPHGLRGQVVLGGATVQEESTENTHILCVTTAEEERLFAFEDEEELSSWKEAIEKSIDSCVVTTPPSPLTKRKQFLKGANRLVKSALPDANFRGGIRVIRSATGGGIKVIKSAKDGSIKVIRGAVGLLRPRPNDERMGLQRRPSIQMLVDSSADEVMRHGSTVQCVAQRAQRYDVVGLDGHKLVTVQAKLFQAFLLSGGNQGTITRGDTVVELDFEQ